MLLFSFGLVCAFITIALAAVYRVYTSVSVVELKRRARKGDEVASLLYRAVAFGLSLKLLLGALATAFGYAALALFEKALGLWVAGLLVIALLLAGIVMVLTHGGVTKVSLWLALRLSRPLGWLLEWLNPLFALYARLVRRLLPVHIHTGVYEKNDLADLLTRQKTQPDNRIDPREIDLLTHALSFGDKMVSEILTPKRVVKTVRESDQVGPVLMDELHATGYSRFPVVEDETIVGVLYLHDLVDKKQGGEVKDVMRRHVRFVHETFTLFEVLQAFLKTKQHLFVVVNEFEEYVGVVTIEDVIEQMIGTSIVDEFDQYDDLRAVAAKAAAREHTAHLKSEEEQGKPAE